MANTYVQGTEIDITATLTQRSSGNPVDPTTVQFHVRPADGVVAVYDYSLSQLQKISTGVYKLAALLLNSSGWWYYYVVTTGGAVVAEGSFYVKPFDV